MGSSEAAPAGPSGRSLALALVGWLGLAACLTMVFLAMRAVMAIGGVCAEGGPYVISQPCPEGSAPALFLGIFGGLLSGFVASVGGFGVGGIWAATPLLAWAALFGSLGWNFMDYGVFNAGGQGIEWGWAICGVVFWIMAIVPLLALIPALRGEWLGAAPGRGTGSGRPAESRPGSARVTLLAGPGQPDRINAASASGTREENREENREELAQIAADFGAAIGVAMADVPLDPDLRAMGAADRAARPGSGEAFTEGTQALLDRLERLADMRDRDLLAPAEYDTAKAAIMAELEGRS